MKRQKRWIRRETSRDVVKRRETQMRRKLRKSTQEDAICSAHMCWIVWIYWLFVTDLVTPDIPEKHKRYMGFPSS